MWKVVCMILGSAFIAVNGFANFIPMTGEENVIALFFALFPILLDWTD